MHLGFNFAELCRLAPPDIVEYVKKEMEGVPGSEPLSPFITLFNADLYLIESPQDATQCSDVSFSTIDVLQRYILVGNAGIALFIPHELSNLFHIQEALILDVEETVKVEEVVEVKTPTLRIPKP